MVPKQNSSLDNTIVVRKFKLLEKYKNESSKVCYAVYLPPLRALLWVLPRESSGALRYVDPKIHVKNVYTAITLNNTVIVFCEDNVFENRKNSNVVIFDRCVMSLKTIRVQCSPLYIKREAQDTVSVYFDCLNSQSQIS